MGKRRDWGGKAVPWLCLLHKVSRGWIGSHGILSPVLFRITAHVIANLVQATEYCHGTIPSGDVCSPLPIELEAVCRHLAGEESPPQCAWKNRAAAFLTFCGREGDAEPT